MSSTPTKRVKALSALAAFLTYGLANIGLLASAEKPLTHSDFRDSPTRQQYRLDEAGTVTWWFPKGASSYILPLSAGIKVDPNKRSHRQWLEKSESWSLMELPAIGATYGDRTFVMIAPWPHYAKMVTGDSLGIRFEIPEGRADASPTDVITVSRPTDSLAVAKAFRDWRETTDQLGAIPPIRTLSQKIEDLSKAERLLGAPHIYLWGPSLFSQHDLPRNKWIPFAEALMNASSESFAGKLVRSFSDEQRGQLEELAKSDWPAAYLSQGVAQAINNGLTNDRLLASYSSNHPTTVSQENQQALKASFSNILRPVESWGDGFSKPLLDSLHESGIERANLVLHDLLANSAKPALASYAEELGYLVGPYDSYHSIHSPNSPPDDTWETAQFDLHAFEEGHVRNADGSGHGGFKGIGYHFSPEVAWPYVQSRVGNIVSHTNYSTWFIDCDATGECFDDYHPAHPASRLEDSELRRHRLDWIETTKGMVVGSEGGSVIFSDVIHYGHGVNTHYIGHLSPSFKDRQSPHFLGRHWPPHEPEMFFKPIPVPPELVSPYFDPTIRIPLYQAALGDQLIATHHWNFGSLKFSDIEHTRALIEILYMVPPMYHLNRSSWESKKEKILKHYHFWSPLHRELATAPLSKFEYLSKDRQVQRTTFETPEGNVNLTVNFSDDTLAGYPPRSATVDGPIEVGQRVYTTLH